MHDIAKQLTVAEDQLNEAFQERRDVIRAAILALLCAEHLFMLGVPGVAKSLLIRTLVSIFRAASYFEIALSKNRPPEAILGPVDLPELRTTGNYWLKRKGYASDSHLIMLDEVGKMSDIVGHDLLALLNERVIHEVRDGLSVHPAPLSTGFTASNEELGGQSDDAAALDDRLLFRVEAEPIKERANFVAMILNRKAPSVDVTIEWDDMAQVITEVIPAIEISDAAVQALVRLRYDRFPNEGIAISDRRWWQAVKALQASAFLAGRDEATAADIASLQYVLWMTTDQREKASRLCMIEASPFAARLFEVREVLDSVNEELGAREQLDHDDHNRDAYGPDATRKLDDVRDRLDTYLMEAAGEPIPMFRSVSDYHKATLLRLYTGILNQPREVAETEMMIDQLGQGDGGNR